MKVRRVCVVGLGVVGKRLTQYFLLKGYEVVGYNGRNLEKKREEILEGLQRLSKKGLLFGDDVATLSSRLHLTSDISKIINSDLIIETLKEDLKLKRNFFDSLNQHNVSGVMIGTCSSSIVITDLARSEYSFSIVGLHFFNPPSKIKLVEVSLPVGLSDLLSTKIRDFLKSLGDRVVIEMPVIPGYVVNRLLLAQINHAIEFLQQEQVSAEIIDESMRAGAGYPMGPLQVADLIGIDTLKEILDSLYTATGDFRYLPNQKLDEMISSGSLGWKTKSGFYSYESQGGSS